MKKLVPNAPFFALILGGISMGLRLWMLAGGTDDQGLYPRLHPAWILLCLLSVSALCLFFILSHRTERRRTYKDNFPASRAAFVGNLAAALGIAVTGIRQWSSSAEALAALTGLWGLLCSGLLVYAALLRLRGNKRPFFIPAALCLFFALQIFTTGRLLGSQPELSRYLFPFLAVLAMLLASYQQWGFDVNQGDRCKSLFWNLTGAYLCLVAAPGSAAWAMYVGVALWLLTDLCSLQPIRRNPAPEEVPDPAADLPPEEPFPEDMDTDALIAQILQELEE